MTVIQDYNEEKTQFGTEMNHDLLFDQLSNNLLWFFKATYLFFETFK